MIKYSIIICTYNRFNLLIETIDSIINVLKNREDYEILVIDNNSKDKTPSVKDRYFENQKIKYFVESQQGLSHARNRGINEANGEILVYFDDDIELIENYFEVCDEIFSEASISIVGGKVLPYRVSIPTWIPVKFYYLVSIFDLGNEEKSVNTLMGANYVLRSNVCKNVGHYNTELGRKGNNLMGGEENDYFSRAMLLGYKIFYNPNLIVFHKINDKLNRNYIFQYSFEQGKSERIIDESLSKLKVFIKIIKSITAILLYKSLGNFVKNEKTKNYLIIIKQYGQGYLSKR